MKTGLSACPVGVARSEYAEALLMDLYVRLRRDLKRWATVTHQTPQPRMGYVGQHLVSVVTGFPGGRSGARGDDLKLPGGRVAEIKCCYRVDQLGQCRACGTAVASIEQACPNESCKSTDLQRRDDSKWLLSPRTEQELREMFLPAAYYLVLFEFVDVASAADINVSIYQLDPAALGFALCLIDYYFNIGSHSSSRAPFNLWPGSPKLLMMRPMEIYRALIKADDTIQTIIFPGRDKPSPLRFGALQSYSSARTFTDEALDAFAKRRRIKFPAIPTSVSARAQNDFRLQHLEAVRVRDKWADAELADDLARAVYAPKVRNLTAWTKEFARTL